MCARAGKLPKAFNDLNNTYAQQFRTAYDVFKFNKNPAHGAFVTFTDRVTGKPIKILKADYDMLSDAKAYSARGQALANTFNEAISTLNELNQKTKAIMADNRVKRARIKQGYNVEGLLDEKGDMLPLIGTKLAAYKELTNTAKKQRELVNAAKLDVQEAREALHAHFGKNKGSVSAYEKLQSDLYHLLGIDNYGNKFKEKKQLADMADALDYAYEYNLLQHDNYKKKLEDLRDGKLNVVDYINDAFNDKDFVYKVDCPEGHISKLEYSLLAGGDYGGLLKVTFRNRGDAVIFFDVPPNVAGYLIRLGETMALAPSQYIKVSSSDGRVKTRHMLGVEFWNLVRIRKQDGGDIHSTRYAFAYATDNRSMRTYAIPGRPPSGKYTKIYTADNDFSIKHTNMSNPLLDNNIKKEALDYISKLSDKAIYRIAAALYDDENEGWVNYYTDTPLYQNYMNSMIDAYDNIDYNVDIEHLDDKDKDTEDVRKQLDIMRTNFKQLIDKGYYNSMWPNKGLNNIMLKANKSIDNDDEDND